MAVSPTVVQAKGLIAPIEEKQFTPWPQIVASRVVYPPTTNRFKKGWCTYWVAQRRAGIDKPVTWGGNAGNWAINAKKQGYTVSPTPQVGSIYVTKAENSRNCKGCGHVGIVIDVRENGIVIEAMNEIGFGKVNTRWVSAEKLHNDGVLFID